MSEIHLTEFQIADALTGAHVQNTDDWRFVPVPTEAALDEALNHWKARDGDAAGVHGAGLGLRRAPPHQRLHRLR